MKIVAISDTHNQHDSLTIPECDILIHAGDATMIGSPDEMKAFFKWFSNQPAKQRIFVPGNHEVGYYHWFARLGLTLDDTVDSIRVHSHEYPDGVFPVVDSERITNNDPYLLIYGSPWTKVSSRWAWQFSEWPENGITPKAIWGGIPNDTDILVTHGPPYGILDFVPHKNISPNNPSWLVDLAGRTLGDRVMLEEIKKRPSIKYHFFGHIHEGHGHLEVAGVKYYNVSICDEGYKPVNPITIVEIDE